MHEVVERHMESMIQEFEELKRRKLFTDVEIKFILRKCKEFENKIYGISKHKSDFEEYIRYLEVLIKQIKQRREKYKLSERTHTIEYKILCRIKTLYELALQRWPADFDLYLSFFKFSKRSNFLQAATQAINGMLKNCANEPNVWLIAGRWYANDRNELNVALRYINKGLTKHKDNKKLFTEALKLELSVVKPNYEPNEILQKQVCDKLQTYINFICKQVKDCHYLVEVLNLIQEYSFTKKVQNYLISKLMELYADKEFVWHTLAQREKNGLHYGDDLETLKRSGETSLTLCFNKYQQGLQKVSPSEKQALWSKYIDCLREANHKPNELCDTIKSNLLKSSLQQAANEGYLEERYFIVLIEHASDEEAWQILEKATTVFPDSIDLWKLYLRYATMTEKNHKVREIFDKGVAVLQEKSLPLWLMLLRYYGLLDREAVIDEIYQKGIKQPLDVSNFLKPKYIEWLAVAKGINEARKTYNVISNEHPYCKELHLAMLKVESLETCPDYKIWEQVHVKVCTQFGADDVDVWINYILFFVQFNKTPDASIRIQNIQDESFKKLDPLLHDEFRESMAKALQ